MRFIIFFLYLGAILPYGLYHPEHSRYFALVLSIIAGVFWLYDIVRGKKPNIPIWLLPMPVLYLVPYFFNRESVQGTINQIIVFTTYVIFYFLLMKGKSQVNDVVLAISWSVALLSFSIIGGMVSFPNFILSLSKDVSGLGERLSGFTQYPNAFATLLGGMLLYHLISSVKETIMKKYYLHSLLLPAISALFLLTESRGAWLSFTVCWLVSLWFIEKNQQLQYIGVTGFSFAIGLILYIVMTRNGEIQFSFLALVILIVVTFGTTLLKSNSKLNKLLVLWQSKLLAKIHSAYFLPILLMVLMVLAGLDLYFKGLFYQLLPEGIQHRLIFGTGTLEDRVIYWKDALSHLPSFAFVGLGGDGWASLMYRVQSYPYLTKELHNGFLDIFVELGFAGLIYILILVVWTGKRLFQLRSSIFPVFLFIFLHGFIDFSYSFPAVVMWTLLLVVPAIEEGKFEKSWPVQITFIIFILCSSFLTIKMSKAEHQYLAATVSSSKEEAVSHIKAAIEQNQWNNRYLFFAMENELFSDSESVLLLKKGLDNEPHHSLLQIYLADVYTRQGKIDDAEILYQVALANDRFDIKKYEKICGFYINQANELERAGKSEKADLYRSRAAKLIKRVENLVLKLENSPVQNQREFQLSKELMEMKDSLAN